MHAAQRFEDAATAAAVVYHGVVRVTAAVGLVRHVLAPLVGELVRLHPEIRLDVRATNALVDLADEGIDLALRSGSLAAIPGHAHQMWFQCPWVICAAPAYLAGRTVPHTLDDLAAHTLIGFRNQRTGRVQPWPHARHYEVRAHIAFDGDAVWAALLAGAGIGCAPLYMAAAALRAGSVVEVWPTSAPLPRHLDGAPRAPADPIAWRGDGVPPRPAPDLSTVLSACSVVATARAVDSLAQGTQPCGMAAAPGYLRARRTT